MSFKIKSGLFKFDLTDHHAILGVPVDADFKDIRKRYLQIARRLHPDSCGAKTETDKERYSQLLSKLVNPAYEQFSQKRAYLEYILVLSEMGKHLVQSQNTLDIKSEAAKQLIQTNNVEHVYKTSLYQLAQKQYDSLDRVLQIIAQISELNLVYLMRTEGDRLQSGPPPSVSLPTQQTLLSQQKEPTQTPAPAPQAPPPLESLAEQYLRRAQMLIENGNFPQARVELQDALKLEPNNSRCHSMIGVVYLKQNQITMAKVHFNKALQLEPQDQMALKGQQLLSQPSQKAGGNAAMPKGSQSKTQDKHSGNTGGSGLFGGLFGGKKK